jgi:hypothetical protein
MLLKSPEWGVLFDVLTGVAMLLVRGAQWWHSARHLIVKNMSITAASTEGARLSRVVTPPSGVSTPKSPSRTPPWSTQAVWLPVRCCGDRHPAAGRGDSPANSRSLIPTRC